MSSDKSFTSLSSVARRGTLLNSVYNNFNSGARRQHAPPG